jgi:colanic acid biosynthesis glycosyl transferase WcaI
MRILFVTQWFDPEPVFKGLAFARELTRRGHQVQVLTGFPNYPGGKIYPGYRVRLLQRERIEGIDIIRVPLYPSHDRSAIGRILNYLSFALAATIVGPFVTARADVIYAYHPPATVGLPALVLRTLFHAGLVYDIMDLWPDTVLATGMVTAKWVIALLKAWCRFVYERADHLTVLSPGFRESLIDRGVAPGKITVIYNWCDEAHSLAGGHPPPARPREAPRNFLVVFAGTMGAAQSLDAVIDAADLLRVRRPDVEFAFIGGGMEIDRLKRKAAALRLLNLRFLPRVPVSAIGPVLAAADALLVHLKDDPLFRITIPSKTQAYMAAGRPIVMAVAGDAQRLVEQARCGITCESENPARIADAVETMARMSTAEREMLGDNGRRFYQANFSLMAGASRFEAVFANLCKRRAAV